MKHTPNRFFEWILRFLLPGYLDESAIYDYRDMYGRIARKEGLSRAKRWYLLQILKSFPLFVRESFFWRAAMIKNYVKITSRNLIKHKIYFFINIFGLSTGLAVCVIILLWVQGETNYDGFHKKVSELAVINGKYFNGYEFYSRNTPAPLAAVLKNEFPEIISTTRFKIRGNVILKYGENLSYLNRFGFTGRAFFDMFTFDFSDGEPSVAFISPYSIVLTEETAKRYFGTEDPVGKTVTLDNRYDMNVTGVLKNNPGNSSIKFDCLVPFEFLKNYTDYLNNWNENICRTYILLKKNTNLRDTRGKISGLIKKQNPGSGSELYIQLLKNIHLQLPDGSYSDLYINLFVFPALALIILVIACLNFMNLSTARYIHRAKEVGIRKVVGADIFILAGILTLSGAFLTVCFQSIKAASANPVDSLRNE